MTPETPRTTTPLESESLLVTGPRVRKTLLLYPEEEEEEEEAVEENEDIPLKLGRLISHNTTG